MRLKSFGTGILKGMVVTIKHLFRHPITVQYPEQRLHVSRRIRGNELIWYNDRCTGCATCAKACPQGAILIVTSVNPEDNRYVVEKIEVDTGYCIACGLCVEACPYSAIYMGRAYERAKYRRKDVIQTSEQLLPTPERQPSAYMHPEIAENLPRQTLLLEKITEKKQ